MYTLNVVNNYSLALTTITKKVIEERGGRATFNNLGGFSIEVPAMGIIVFSDLGANKLPGYELPKETWGVLVRYCNTEAYYRYEGGGELTATFDLYGSCKLTTSNGTMISIKLEELIIN